MPSRKLCGSVTASSTTLKGFKERPDYFSRGTGAVIDAMKAAGSVVKDELLAAIHKLLPPA